MSPPLLTVRDLQVGYGPTTVARLPRLDVGSGGCTALVGGSGSGKTSVLQAVLGLGPEIGAWVTGSVQLAGVEVVGATERVLRELRGRRVAAVTQSPRSALTPTLRLRRYARVVFARHGLRRRDADDRLDRTLAEVQLDPVVLDRYPHEVSGGQAQRFVIALALALGTELLVADEPTSALDVTVQAEVLRTLASLRRDRGLGVLLVTHDLAMVAEIADDVVVLADGHVVESGPVDRVLGAPTHPVTVELLDAVPRIGGGR